MNQWGALSSTESADVGLRNITLIAKGIVIVGRFKLAAVPLAGFGEPAEMGRQGWDCLLGTNGGWIPELQPGVVGVDANLCPTVPCSQAGTEVDKWLCSGQCSRAKPCLWDVVADPEEKHNMAKSLPQVVAELNGTLARLERDAVAPYLPVANVNGSMCAAFQHRWGGYMGPWFRNQSSEDDYRHDSGVQHRLELRVEQGPQRAVLTKEQAVFSSLHAARDHLRSLRRRQGGLQSAVTVTVGAGVYPPLELLPSDSGTAAFPVTWQAAAHDGSAVISAGAAIPTTLFKPWSGHPGVLRADISSLGLNYGTMGEGGDTTGDCTSFARMGLNFRNASAVLARWPNVLPSTDNHTPGRYVWQKIETAGNSSFSVNSSDAVVHMVKWSEECEPWIHWYTKWDWSDTWAKINVTTTAAGVSTVTTLDRSYISATTGPVTVGQAKFIGVNLLCELDSPNEWFMDKTKGLLYFYPPVPLSAWGKDQVFLTQNLTAASVSANHTILRGLAIRHARGNGVLALNVAGVRVEDCQVSGHGQHGVVITGFQSGIDGSCVHSIGCSGIRIAGGVARTLTPGQCFATRNTVSDFALVKRTYQPGIFWNGVGNTYSHNSVHNSPHVCILGGGNMGQQPDSSPWGGSVVSGSGSQCTFDNNTLDTCAFECGDCAAFYTCGQAGQAWVNRGNLLTNSRFTNIGSRDAISGRPLSGAAIYLDVSVDLVRMNSYLSRELASRGACT